MILISATSSNLTLVQAVPAARYIKVGRVQREGGRRERGGEREIEREGEREQARERGGRGGGGGEGRGCKVKEYQMKKKDQESESTRKNRLGWGEAEK